MLSSCGTASTVRSACHRRRSSSLLSWPWRAPPAVLPLSAGIFSAAPSRGRKRAARIGMGETRNGRGKVGVTRKTVQGRTKRGERQEKGRMEGRWGEEEEGGTEESTARGTLGSNSRPREDYLPWQASGGGCTPR